MKNCENCKYWQKDTDKKYKNFGLCKCDKFIYLDELEKYNYETNELEKKNRDNYHVIYGDYEGYMATLRVHKEFGCIDYKEK